MTKKEIALCKETENKINAILEKEGFTDEAERLMNLVAGFCISKNIDVETYKALVLN